MTWHATAPRGRHRTREPNTGHERTDTIAISALSSIYGRHAADAGNLPKLHPLVVAQPAPAEDDALAPEPHPATGGHRATSRRMTFIAKYLRPRAVRRSA